MILIFLLSLLGDYNNLYLMDKSFSFVPIEEEFQFLYSRNALQTIQGSRDSEKWYEKYRIKIWIPLFSSVVFEYNLNKEDDYEIKVEKHSFKLRWLGSEKAKIPIAFSLLFSPQSSQDKKYLGAGIGYWKNIKNNHSLNIIIHEFDHNYRISHRETSIYEDPFIRFPISVELEGIIKSNQADFNYKYYKKIKAKKKCLENNVQIGRGEYDGMGLKNTIYYHLFTRMLPGIRLNYSTIDSSYFSMPNDSLSYNASVDNFFAELFMKVKISEKNTFYFGVPMSWKYIKNESIEYQRKWIGLTLLYNYSISDCIDLTTGLQHSWRNLNGQKDIQTRAVAGLDLKLNQMTYIAIRQGIEMDFPLPEKLEEYNNHTYLMINHCF